MLFQALLGVIKKSLLGGPAGEAVKLSFPQCQACHTAIAPSEGKAQENYHWLPYSCAGFHPGLNTFIPGCLIRDPGEKAFSVAWWR